MSKKEKDTKFSKNEIIKWSIILLVILPLILGCLTMNFEFIYCLIQDFIIWLQTIIDFIAFKLLDGLFWLLDNDIFPFRLIGYWIVGVIEIAIVVCIIIIVGMIESIMSY